MSAYQIWTGVLTERSCGALREIWQCYCFQRRNCLYKLRNWQVLKGVFTETKNVQDSLLVVVPFPGERKLWFSVPYRFSPLRYQLTGDSKLSARDITIDRSVHKLAKVLHSTVIIRDNHEHLDTRLSFHHRIWTLGSASITEFAVTVVYNITRSRYWATYTSR